MVSTYTTNRLFEKPATGDQVGTWGATVNTNWDYADSGLGGTQALSLASSNVTLSTAQARNLIYSLTGTLTANVTITWPARGGFFIVDNNTTGAFNVTLASAGGGANCLATQAKRTLIMVSATDCKLADDRAATGGGGSGSVTSIGTSGYVTGGTITATGTISLGSMGAASRLLGSAAGAATITDISLGTFLTMSSSTLKVSDLSSTSQLIGSSASAATATNITLGNRLTMSSAQLKVVDMSAVSTLMGSSSAAATVTDIAVGTGLQISGSTLSCTITQGASTATTITGAGYLTGGGSLAANRTITMGSMGAASRLLGSVSSGAAITDVLIGTGLSMNTTTLSNSGVTSNVAGTGISVSGATGAVTITNTGVTSIVAGTGISISGATGAVTVTNSAPSTLTLATAQNTTSGASIDFTGIPAGTKRITIALNNVSTTGSSDVIMRWGTSGGVVTSGYLGSAAVINGASLGGGAFTAGHGLNQPGGAGASGFYCGTVTLVHLGSNVWAASSVNTYSSGGVGFSASSITLGGVLDRVRLTTVGGTDTFDQGSMNILYE